MTPTTLEVPYTRSLVLPAEIELRAEDNAEDFTAIGYAAVFDRRSEDLGGFVEEIKRGAFRQALDDQHDVRLLVNHDGLPLARTRSGTLELREDPKGLRVYARVARNAHTEALRQSIQRGDVDQMSFAFSLAPDGSGESWRQEDGGPVVRTITRVQRLMDVSIVTFPAYPQTSVNMRSVTPDFGGEPEIPDVPGGTEGRDADDTEAREATDHEGRVEWSKRRLAVARMKAHPHL